MSDIYDLNPCLYEKLLPDRLHVVGIHPLSFDFSATTRYFGGCACGAAAPHEENQPQAAATWNLGNPVG